MLFYFDNCLHVIVIFVCKFMLYIFVEYVISYEFEHVNTRFNFNNVIGKVIILVKFGTINVCSV